MNNLEALLAALGATGAPSNPNIGFGNIADVLGQATWPDPDSSNPNRNWNRELMPGERNQELLQQQFRPRRNPQTARWLQETGGMPSEQSRMIGGGISAMGPEELMEAVSGLAPQRPPGREFGAGLAPRMAAGIDQEAGLLQSAGTAPMVDGFRSGLGRGAGSYSGFQNLNYDPGVRMIPRDPRNRQLGMYAVGNAPQSSGIGGTQLAASPEIDMAELERRRDEALSNVDVRQNMPEDPEKKQARENIQDLVQTERNMRDAPRQAAVTKNAKQGAYARDVRMGQVAPEDRNAHNVQGLMGALGVGGSPQHGFGNLNPIQAAILGQGMGMPGLGQIFTDQQRIAADAASGARQDKYRDDMLGLERQKLAAMTAQNTAEANAKLGILPSSSPAFAAAAAEKAAQFSGLEGEGLYDKVGALLDSLAPNLPADPARAAETAKLAGLTPETLRQVSEYRPEDMGFGSLKIPRSRGSWNNFDKSGGSWTSHPLASLFAPIARPFAEGKMDYENRLRRQDSARALMKILGVGTASTPAPAARAGL